MSADHPEEQESPSPLATQPSGADPNDPLKVGGADGTDKPEHVDNPSVEADPESGVRRSRSRRPFLTRALSLLRLNRPAASPQAEHHSSDQLPVLFKKEDHSDHSSSQPNDEHAPIAPIAPSETKGAALPSQPAAALSEKKDHASAQSVPFPNNAEPPSTKDGAVSKEGQSPKEDKTPTQSTTSKEKQTEKPPSKGHASPQHPHLPSVPWMAYYPLWMKILGRLRKKDVAEQDFGFTSTEFNKLAIPVSVEDPGLRHVKLIILARLIIFLAAITPPMLIFLIQPVLVLILVGLLAALRAVFWRRKEPRETSLLWYLDLRYLFQLFMELTAKYFLGPYTAQLWWTAYLLVADSEDFEQNFLNAWRIQTIYWLLHPEEVRERKSVGDWLLQAADRLLHLEDDAAVSGVRMPMENKKAVAKTSEDMVKPDAADTESQTESGKEKNTPKLNNADAKTQTAVGEETNTLKENQTAVDEVKNTLKDNQIAVDEVKTTPKTNQTALGEEKNMPKLDATDIKNQTALGEEKNTPKSSKTALGEEKNTPRFTKKTVEKLKDTDHVEGPYRVDHRPGPLPLFVGKECMEIPMLMHGIDDSRTLHHLRMFYRYSKVKRGVIELVIPRRLVYIDRVEVGEEVPMFPGHLVKTLELGRSLYRFHHPRAAKDSQEITTQLQNIACAHASRALSKQSRTQQEESLEGLEFLRQVNFLAVAGIIMTPPVASFITLVIYMPVFLTRIEGDDWRVQVQAIVASAFAIAAYLVTTGGFVTGLAVYFDSIEHHDQKFTKERRVSERDGKGKHRRSSESGRPDPKPDTATPRISTRVLKELPPIKLPVKEETPFEAWYRDTFPHGCEVLQTSGANLQCAMHAVILTMQEMYPDTPRPTVSELEDILKNPEYVKMAEKKVDEMYPVDVSAANHQKEHTGSTDKETPQVEAAQKQEGDEKSKPKIKTNTTQGDKSSAKGTANEADKTASVEGGPSNSEGSGDGKEEKAGDTTALTAKQLELQQYTSLNNLSGEQIGAILHYWGDTWHDLNVQAVLVTDAHEPRRLTGMGSFKNAIIVCIYHNIYANEAAQEEKAQGKESQDKQAVKAETKAKGQKIWHYCGVRPVRSA